MMKKSNMNFKKMLKNAFVSADFLNFDSVYHHVRWYSYLSLIGTFVEVVKNLLLFLFKSKFPLHKYLVEVQIAKTSYQDKFNMSCIFVFLGSLYLSKAYVQVRFVKSFHWMKFMVKYDDETLQNYYGLNKLRSQQFQSIVLWMQPLYNTLIVAFRAFAWGLLGRGIYFGLTENWKLHQSWPIWLIPLFFSFSSFYAINIAISIIISNNILFGLSVIFFIFRLKSMTNIVYVLIRQMKKVQIDTRNSKVRKSKQNSNVRSHLRILIGQIEQFVREVATAQKFFSNSLSVFFVSILILATTLPYLMIFEERDPFYNTYQSLFYVNVLFWFTCMVCLISARFYRNVRTSIWLICG